jgi:hypothetical protein
MTRCPDLDKSGASENRDPGETQCSRTLRIPPTVGLERKTRQTRRFVAGRGFLRCECRLRHKQPAEPACAKPAEGKERVSSSQRSLNPRASRSMPLLRTARFPRRFFGDQQDTQSWNRSHQKENA